MGVWFMSRFVGLWVPGEPRRRSTGTLRGDSPDGRRMDAGWTMVQWPEVEGAAASPPWAGRTLCDLSKAILVRRERCTQSHGLAVWAGQQQQDSIDGEAFVRPGSFRFGADILRRLIQTRRLVIPAGQRLNQGSKTRQDEPRVMGRGDQGSETDRNCRTANETAACQTPADIRPAVWNVCVCVFVCG